jgi:hypothetical protein
LPGVVFQYLIYTDGTDNLKYVTKGTKGVGIFCREVLQNLQLVWDGIAAGGEMEKTKNIAECVEAKTKWTAQWKYIMPNGEIRTHFGCASPSYLADGTVLFNSYIRCDKKPLMRHF